MADIPLESILKVLEIFSIVGGGAVVAFRLGRTTQKVEEAIATQNILMKEQASDITDLKFETKKLSEVVTQLAVQHTRLDRIEDDIRDMKHGRGYVIEESPPRTLVDPSSNLRRRL